MIREIGKENTIFNRFLSELRDANIQQNRMRFRRNMERVGEIFAYEISKTFSYSDTEIVTPLGIAHMQLPVEKPVLATILRAGLPFHQGLLNYFDDSDSAYVSAYRKYTKDEDFTIKLDYVSAPSLDGKVLIISDPMLATGGSLVAALKGLMLNGEPKHIHVVTLLASDEGIMKLKRHFSLKPFTLWVGAVDDELTAKAYIVPGLGDAGDLAFGQKED